jgi:hypothetical protein
MIRFVDLRGAETGYRFAFFCTVVNRFISIGDAGDQAFDSWEELEPLLIEAEADVQRYRALMPEWALVRETPEPETEEDWSKVEVVPIGY